jgi:hypothetical protein
VVLDRPPRRSLLDDEDLTVGRARADVEAAAGRQPRGECDLGGRELGQEVREGHLPVDHLADQAHEVAFDA